MSAEFVFRNVDLTCPDITGEMIISNAKAGDMLLVKASRGVRAERVIEYLRANEERLRYGK